MTDVKIKILRMAHFKMFKNSKMTPQFKEKVM